MRPQICFESWGEIPSDRPEAIPLVPSPHSDKKFLQRGFNLVNDGGVAHEITVESFEIGPGMRATGETLPRIPEKGKGFALAWLDGYFAPTPEKFDLLGAMAEVCRTKYPIWLIAPDCGVVVSVVYRDADKRWYRSSANMTYIRSQNRIQFGATTQEEASVSDSHRTPASQGPCPVGGNFLPGIAKGAIRMGGPSRYEIKQLADDQFAVVRDEILAEYEEKRKQVLGEVRRTGNSGGYLPALVAWGAERLRSMVLALADAYVESFKLHRVTSDTRAEADLQASAQEIAAGTISAIRGELDLVAKRTSKPPDDPGGHLNREIDAAMKSALKKGVLRLRRQRSESLNSESPLRAAGAMTAVEFWRDVEVRFRALQSRKVPVHGIPWHDDSLYAAWLSTGWSETGDQWRLCGADHAVRVKFEWLAERAAVELGHPGGRSAVVFWLDLLRRDSPNYKITGSGGGDNGLTRDEHGKIDRVCEASGDYCIRLETQDRLTEASKVPSVMIKSERTLTETQQRKISDAERELKDNLDAHEMMREIVEPGEWQPVAPLANAPTMASEIPKLERDIRKCAVVILGALADASWALGSTELFRARIEGDSRDILEWVRAKVNKKDLPLLDWSAIEEAVNQEASTWIDKAQREFPPPWRANAAPHASPQIAEKQDSGFAEPATEQSDQAAQATARQAVVMPILKARRWKRGKWATQAGVGKNSVYEYLNGKRKLTDENRRAMAEVLQLNPEDLPD